jgi:hypothetical protein
MQNKNLSSSTVRLEWSRSLEGYESRRFERVRNPLLQFLVARGARREIYDVALGEKRIFVDLLNMEKTPEGALSFANKWGLLDVDQTSLGDFYNLRDWMRAAIAHARRYGVKALVEPPDEKVVLGTAEVRIAPKPGSKKTGELLWYANSLRLFCVLQVWSELGGAAEVVMCEQCGDFFTKSRKGPSPSTCSDKCRHAKMRRRRRAREAGGPP